MFRIVHKVNGYCSRAWKKREENILTASAQVLIWVQRIIHFSVIKRENRVLENVFHNEESQKINH